MPSFSLVGVVSTLLGGEFLLDPGAEKATFESSVEARDMLVVVVELRGRSGLATVAVVVADAEDVRVGAAREE